jgi:hypothetical protein
MRREREANEALAQALKQPGSNVVFFLPVPRPMEVPFSDGREEL